MTAADQDLQARLAEIISSQSDALDIAEGILDYPALLDDICEYRARQINEQRDIEPGLADTVDRMVRLSGRGVSVGQLLIAREAAASVALDHDDRAETISFGTPYPTSNPNSQES